MMNKYCRYNDPNFKLVSGNQINGPKLDSSWFWKALIKAATDTNASHSIYLFNAPDPRKPLKKINRYHHNSNTT
jgi:hypothetical protein